MPVRLVALVLVLALSGCFGEHCGPSTSLSWWEDGSYARVGEASGVVEHPPAPGADVDEPALREAWTAFTLLEMGETPPTGRSAREARAWLDLRAAPTLHLWVGADATEEDVRARASGFLGKVSAADEATRAAWVDGLAASRRPVGWGPGGTDAPPIQYGYSLEVAPPFRFETLLDGDAAVAALREPMSSAGNALFRDAEGLQWWFSLAVREVEVPRDAPPVRVRVDAAGLVMASTEGGGAEAVPRIADAIGGLGLDPAQARAAEPLTVIC